MKFFRRIREYYYLLLKKKENPERVARGIAIGVFVAFSPLLGFHTVMCIIFSLIFNASKTASILGSLICNPLTIPIIFFSEYEVGKYIMISMRFQVNIIEYHHFKHLTLYSLIELGKMIFIPTFIGSIVFGIIFGIAAYFYSKKYFTRVFNEI